MIWRKTRAMKYFNRPQDSDKETLIMYTYETTCTKKRNQPGIEKGLFNSVAPGSIHVNNINSMEHYICYFPMSVIIHLI